tara:strand:+ start:1015 stop:1440 length:426 start_codon:yes stop_codon:yes gene_type:complete
MLSTIDSSDDDGIRMDVPSVDLAAISKLKETLTDFHGSTVNLIEEEHNGLLTSGYKPVGSVPSGSLATIDRSVGSVRETEEIALGHLGSTTLDNGEPHVLGDHVNNLRLADAMTTTDKDRETPSDNVRSDVKEGSEVNSHE